MSRKKHVEILKALADETRFEILKLLLEGEKCVCEIVPKVNRTQPTVSIQLSKLEKIGLVKSRRVGKKIFYGIAAPVVYDIFRAIGYLKESSPIKSQHAKSVKPKG